MVENNQRKLSEKIDDASRRQQELDNLLDIQRQTLHKISAMSVDEARRQLLERLNQELAHEQGAIILKQEKELAAVVDAKAMAITAIAPRKRTDDRSINQAIENRIACSSMNTIDETTETAARRQETPCA